MQMDGTNLRLLDALQRNGRAGVSDLARWVGRGESTVRDRMAALEREGVILGYRALVDSARVGLHATALVRADCDHAGLTPLARRLEAVPNVTKAVLTTGEKPLRIEIMASDVTGVQRIIENRVAGLGLQRIETGVVLQALVPARPAPLWNEYGTGPGGTPLGGGKDQGRTLLAP